MHPYKTAADRAFWSRSVSSGFDASALVSGMEPLVQQGDVVASAGSCFASNLVPFLEGAGFTYLRTEPQHPAFAALPAEAFGYANFSAAYGNIYTARQLLQLLRRSRGAFAPAEDRWHTAEGVIDPFRPGLRYHAVHDVEFDLLTGQHLAAVRTVFERATVFIFTLGLTEAWVSAADGAVFPACPGTIAGSFDATRHRFVNFTASEVVADLEAFLGELRTMNPAVRVVLTVSPVPLVATATEGHVLRASIYSKSVLRVAAEEISTRIAGVTYFPAYEIVTGPQAPHAFFQPDRRNVSDEAVRTVMSAFLAACGTVEGSPGTPLPPKPDAGADLSEAIVAIECEELMADASFEQARKR